MTTEHKRVIAALGLVAALLFVYLYQYNREQLPEVPILSGATDVQKAVNLDAAGSPDDPLEAITFTVEDEPRRVEAYVRGAMQQHGWQQDSCCRSLYRHPNSDSHRVGNYMAEVSIAESESSTYVTIRVTHGKISCDCTGIP
jgi:hypothetical protein